MANERSPLRARAVRRFDRTGEGEIEPSRRSWRICTVSATVAAPSASERAGSGAATDPPARLLGHRGPRVVDRADDGPRLAPPVAAGRTSHGMGVAAAACTGNPSAAAVGIDQVSPGVVRLESHEGSARASTLALEEACIG